MGLKEKKIRLGTFSLPEAWCRFNSQLKRERSREKEGNIKKGIERRRQKEVDREK